MRLGLHVAEQAELVRARTHLEGAKSLQEEGAEVWVGVQAAANQAPAQSHHRHDACHQQQRRPDATDGHGETERRLSQGSRTQREALAPLQPHQNLQGEKKRGKGRADGSAQPLKEEKLLLFQPAHSLPGGRFPLSLTGVQAEGGAGPGNPVPEEGRSPPWACGAPSGEAGQGEHEDEQGQTPLYHLYHPQGKKYRARYPFSALDRLRESAKRRKTVKKNTNK